MQKLLVSFMVSFVMKQIEKLEGKVDWKKLESDLDEHIRLFFPVKFLDDDIIGLAAVVFQEIQKVLSQQDQMKAIVSLLAQEKFEEALQALKALLIASLEVLPHEAALLAL